MTIAEERPLAEPECWISLRTAEAQRCAISIAGALTANAGRLVRRWVVLLRDAVGGDVTIHCDALRQIDDGGAALLRELIWGLEAQQRQVQLLGLPAGLLPAVRSALEGDVSARDSLDDVTLHMSATGELVLDLTISSPADAEPH